MKTVSVIPITRNIGRETLTYYTDQHVASGDIVGIPLRRKEVPALVVDVQSVKTQKAQLRSASFSMRKMKTVYTTSFFSPAFMSALAMAAEYFISSTGSLLNTLVPKDILTETFSIPKYTDQKETQHEIQVLQDNKHERIAYHKSLTRESFAKKQSVILIAPTRIHAEQYFEEMKRGIENHVVLLHSGLTKKKLVAAWKETLTNTHPILIVATPQFLSIPRNDIAMIILEEESSRHYKEKRLPYVDYRTFASFLAQEIRIPIVFADELVRLETLHKIQLGEAISIGRPNMHRTQKVQTHIVDMREYKKTSDTPFRTVSNDVLKTIHTMDKATDHCFIFSLRKGLYPLTVCGDCGNLVRCHTCHAPVVVHKSTHNQFVCHKCGSTRNAEEKCAECDSWNLVPLGVGTTRVAEEIKESLPKIPVTLIDTDTMTAKQIENAVELWLETPASVLVGTEIVLQYLKKVTHIAVASLDTLFSLPDFRANERILKTILLLQSLADQTLHIQTRNPEQSIFKYALESNIAKWQQEELKERKQFNYPPFSTLIKITTRAPEEKLKEIIEKLEQLLTAYDPHTFAAFTPKTKGGYVVHTLLNVPSDTWPDTDLVSLLKNLPQQHIVQVDPDHLM